MRITISGSPGTGTTTLGRALAEKYQYRYLSAGEVFRSFAKESGMDLAAFGERAKEDPKIDLDIDARQKQIGESSDNIILEGRLAGWMVENADLKILLSASSECRAERIAAREGLSFDEAYTATLEREACEAERYMQYYEIDIRDISPYDLIISSETFDQVSLFAVVDAAVSRIFAKKQEQ